jgi:hypothetical protein
MVLISIQPFVLRKVFLVIAALLCFSALCFGDPVLMAQHYVPRAASFEATTHSILQSQAKEDVFQAVDQPRFDCLCPVDLPSRDQRLLPKAGATFEAFLQDNPGDTVQQTA